MAIPNSLNFGAARLKGRARGALVCSVFGAGWMFHALVVGAVATPAWLAVIGLFAVAFVVWPVVQLNSLRRLAYLSADRQFWPAVSKAFWSIVAIEWLALNAATNWLRHIGHSDLIPQFMGVIVGLHFLPLAKIFKALIYCWTGIAMVLGSLASLVVPAEHTRAIVACGLSGLSLWATAAVILCQDKASSR